MPTCAGPLYDLLLAFPSESANHRAYLDELFEVFGSTDPIVTSFSHERECPWTAVLGYGPQCDHKRMPPKPGDRYSDLFVESGCGLPIFQRRFGDLVEAGII